MGSCHSLNKEQDSQDCHGSKKKIDFLLYFLVIVCVIAYGLYALNLVFKHSLALEGGEGWLSRWMEVYITFFSEGQSMTFTHTIFSFINKMYLGVILGVLFAGIVGYLPQEVILRMFAVDKPILGILRASFAGMLLDVCSHGVLLIGVKLYKQGLRVGQLMAFLIATPWNSLSLTFILFALIGIPLTLLYIFFSFAIALITGLIFEILMRKKYVPENPYAERNKEKDSQRNLGLLTFLRSNLNRRSFSLKNIFLLSVGIIRSGISELPFLLKWLFFGVVLVALVRTFMPLEAYGALFGPTLIGLLLTILVATIMEVCSEGSVPLATSLVTTARAPGNGFAFLMAGVSTDLTEILVLKDTFKSWKMAFLLPLITLPQIFLLGYFLNRFNLFG